MPKRSSRVTSSLRSPQRSDCSTFSWSSSTVADAWRAWMSRRTRVAAWTLQQLREVIGFDHAYRYLLHDRDSIFARQLDDSIGSLGLSVLKSPPRSPKANAICERVIGTIRRECLDWVVPLSEAHLRLILKEWVAHYNRGRPHSMLGPGVPDPPRELVAVPKSESAIDSRPVRSSMPDRSWAACITSIFPHRHRRTRSPCRETCGGTCDANNCGAQNRRQHSRLRGCVRFLHLPDRLGHTCSF